MTSAQIATLDCTRPCLICYRHMDLSEIETVSWAPRTTGERLSFRCAKCRNGLNWMERNPRLGSAEIAPK